MGKGEIAHNEQFLLFPQCFLTIWRTFCDLHQIWNCLLQTLWFWTSLKFVVWERVNLLVLQIISSLPHNPDFWLEGNGALETFLEKEKMLVTSIFSFFFQNVFYHSKHNLKFISQIYFDIFFVNRTLFCRLVSLSFKSLPNGKILH